MTQPVTAAVQIAPPHNAVLQGLLMRNPNLSLSDLIYFALEPFCEQHADAASETKIYVETTAPAKEPV